MFNLIFITHTFIYLRIFIRKHFVFIIHIIIVPNLTHWNKSQGLKLFITQKERKLSKVQVRLAHGRVVESCGRVARTRFEASRTLSRVDPEEPSFALSPTHASHTRPRTSRARASASKTPSFSSILHPKPILQVCKA